MQPDQWHYKDERSGKRLGPVGRDEIEQLVGKSRIERSTLVWNPSMPQWAVASTTDLASFFGNEPPPLPASEINRWALYALSLFPLIGLAIQAIASTIWATVYKQSPQDVFEQPAWLLLFIVGNGVLGELDEWNLRRGGLRLRGAAIFAGVLAPVYIYTSCRIFRRHARNDARLAYLPLLLWVAAFATMIAVEPLLFNSDAPLIFRPDEWL